MNAVARTGVALLSTDQVLSAYPAITHNMH